MTAARMPLLLALPAGAGAAAAVAVVAAAGVGGLAGAGVIAAVAVAAVCVVWPWLVLPLGVLGGTMAASLLGFDAVTEVIVLNVVLLGCGLAGAALRRALDRTEPARVRTAADLPMLALAGVLPVAAAYGLATGNPAHDVAVALYQMGIVPASFFAATLTLTTRRRLVAALTLFAGGAALLALAELATLGRHGGLLSALALPIALVAVVRERGAVRALALAAACVLALDVILASYRSIWLATALTLVVLLARGGPQLRAGAAVVLTAGALFAAASVTLVPGVSERSAAVATYLDEPAGYRLPESVIGWQAFLGAPVAGEGLGHVARNQPVAGLGTVDIGPTYHAFYVTVLANAGLAGAALILWPLLVALRRRPGDRDPAATAARALLWGFLAAAAFAAPSNGHWELGLLAALAVLPASLSTRDQES